jgi:hypothetical protein
MNKHLPRALALILAGSVTLTGCATIDSTTQSLGHAVGIKNDNTASAVSGGVIGCGAGALIGHFLGKSALAGCALGGATGAIASIQIHRHELEKARALAADAQQTKGVTAVVATKTVDAKDDNGQPTKTEALDKLTITLPGKDVQTHALAVQRILVKAANVADSSAEITTIEVKGTLAERTWMTSQLREAFKVDSTVKLIQTDAPTPSLVISPIPTSAR